MQLEGSKSRNPEKKIPEDNKYDYRAAQHIDGPPGTIGNLRNFLGLRKNLTPLTNGVERVRAGGPLIRATGDNLKKSAKSNRF